jgi:hypothetical protein
MARFGVTVVAPSSAIASKGGKPSSAGEVRGVLEIQNDTACLTLPGLTFSEATATADGVGLATFDPEASRAGDICVTAPSATSFIDSSQRNLLVTLTNNRRVEAEVVPLDHDG